MPYKKKLIEVALPLVAINNEAAKEKSIRHGHPSTLHLWWARRPLAAARAVIWASLVDDPSSLPEQFPTEEAQNAERERLFKILTELVKWENSNNQDVLDRAKAEIMKSTDNNPPPLLDPFAGGGAIPLEAQRLGLEAHASDLNPVAVMINKAMIEIPPKFAGQHPVNPEAKANPVQKQWIGAQGLAEDVRYYGEWMKEKAFEKIGQLYPKVKDKNGREYTVIAWIWARTVKCPNPACGCDMPLNKSWNISKKDGYEVFVEAVRAQGKKLKYYVKRGKSPHSAGTVNRRGAVCICCGSPVGFQYIKDESKAGHMTAQMIAIAAEGENGRVYLSPDEYHENVAKVSKPPNCGFGELAFYPGYINPYAYGITDIQSLFSNRQLTALTTFSDICSEVAKVVEADALTSGLDNDGKALCDNGKSARAYGESISVYLAMGIDRIADRGSTICGWDASRDGMAHTFSLTGMSMTWDYAEANPFSNSSGCFDNALEWIIKNIIAFPVNNSGIVTQFDAQSDNGLRNIMISTDPPYYSNVPYAIFSDFFYVLLRRSIKNIYPDLFRTLLTPKAEELVADPYRAGSKENASLFFESGMLEVCKRLHDYTREDMPVTIYYSFKQNETERQEGNIRITSTGWETMLTAIISAGFSITGTWPMRTELANRTRANNSNALASSIVHVCRKRPKDAPSTNRRQFISELRDTLKKELHILQTSNISPVDFPQASIGPGMEIYSKYSEILEADGTPMSVNTAVALIFQERDAFLYTQGDRMDNDSRFCIAWYEQFGLTTGNYGDAETMSRPMLANLQELVNDGVLERGHNKVRLKRRDELPEKWDSRSENTVWTMVQQLCRIYETKGLDKTAEHMINLSALNSSNLENVKNLAYRTFIAAENKGWADDALAYNSLVTAWPDLLTRMRKLKELKPEQMSMF